MPDTSKIYPIQDPGPKDPLKEIVIKALKKIAARKNSQKKVNAEIISLWNLLKENDPEHFITKHQLKPTEKIEDVKREVDLYIQSIDEQEKMLEGKENYLTTFTAFKPYLKIVKALCKINDDLNESRLTGARRVLNIAYSALVVIPNVMENAIIFMINGNYNSLRVKTPKEKAALSNFNTTINNIIATIEFKIQLEKEAKPKRPSRSEAFRAAYMASATKTALVHEEYTTVMLEYLKESGKHLVYQQHKQIAAEMHEKHGIKF